MSPYVHDPNQLWLYMVGRVKPGVSLPALQAKVSALVRQSLADTRAFANADNKPLLPKVHVVLTPGGGGIQNMQENYGSNLHLLMWISGAVLLIACANIANLLLVRGMGRKAEMSVRTALGATRGRVIQQLLTESVLLAGLGGVAGLAVAYAGTRMLLMLAFPGAQNVPIDAAPSMAVLLFACGLSLVTGVLFGVAPAWIAAQAEPADALRSGARTTTTGRASLLQRGLVVAAGGVVAGAAGGCGIVCAEPEQTREHGSEAGCEEPLYRAHQSGGGGLLADATRGALPHDGRSLPCAAGRDEGGHLLVYADGGRQR